MAKADKRARKRANQAQAAAARAAAAKRASRNRQIRFGAIGVVAVVALVAVVAFTGSSSKKKTPKVATKNTAATTTVAPTTTTIAALKAGCVATVPTKVGNGKQYKTPPAMTIDPTKTYTATFDTPCGSFTATLDAKDSPNGVNNFVFLARQGFYNGLKWHRVVQNFVIQGGDPTGTGRAVRATPWSPNAEERFQDRRPRVGEDRARTSREPRVPNSSSPPAPRRP